MALSNQYLTELAQAYGIATEFWDWKGRLTEVTDETVIAILAALDVSAADPESAAAALEQVRLRPWSRLLPPCVVTEQGTVDSVQVHVPDGEPVQLSVRLEDGGLRDLRQVDDFEAPRWVDGVLVGQASFELPADLPLGYHRLQAITTDAQLETSLIVTPSFLGFPDSLGDKRAWGYAVQLYSLSSADSWGVGDLLDLADLATWSASQQYAGFVLVNPLHAAEPDAPIEPSPYLPTSRRYVNPLYLRPEAIPEYAELGEAERAEIRQAKDELRAALVGAELIDRDLIWAAKVRALQVVHARGLRPARRMALNHFLRREGRSLLQFATWSALATVHGHDWRTWPSQYHRPSAPAVAEFADQHAELISFFAWLQWVADDQLRAAQSAAHDAGMRVGIMNDLAVGVGPQSAEAWTYSNLFASGMGVGAPPDHFNQTGQSWGQAPWRPDRLDELSYAPFRSMVAGILRHCGGIRVDHIMGLFRLWWIPEGMSAAQGSYVRYNHEAMVGILALEAVRAGALVVGEDLGVVEPWVREYLRRRGILGTSVAWFERDDQGCPLPPQAWREYCLASVTTHDLPPTAGYLADEHVRLQHRLGLLTESLETELGNAAAEREAFITSLRAGGYLSADPASTQDVVEALHRYLVATPSRILCAALADAVGDRRTQNQPGTSTEYPNWRVPLSGPDGRPLALEDLYRNERSFRLATIMNDFAVPLNPPDEAELAPLS